MIEIMMIEIMMIEIMMKILEIFMMMLLFQVLLPIPSVVPVGGVPVQGGRSRRLRKGGDGKTQRPLPLPCFLLQRPQTPLQGQILQGLL